MKNNKKHFVSFLLVLSLLSCKSQQNSIYQFDPRTIKENEITLSEIADDITYITLDNSFPIGFIYDTFEFLNSSICLSAKDIGILTFNRDGKFLRKIGGIGRGPGEYTFYGFFTIDDKKGTIYVHDRGSMIKVYSKTGNFLRSISLHEYGGSIDKIESYNSELFLSYALQYDDSKYDWIILDSLGKLIKKKERTIPIFNSNWLEGGGTYIFDHKISYWNQYADTVFSLFPDLNEKPSFIFSPGEHRLPMSNIADPSQLNQYMRIYQIFETSHLLTIYYFYKKRAFVLIDKNTRESFLTYLGPNDSGGIFNDLDGGTLFLPKSYFVENDREYLIGLINPPQIKARVESSEFKSSVPKYPEKKKSLKNWQTA
jgi:6-bladed beta-propeller